MYHIKIDREADAFLENLTEKSNRIIRDHIQRLKKDPYPGHGGDKERVHTEKEEIYRLHVGRSYTVFYQIDGEEHLVYITHIMTIEEAHKRYGRL